eukprot:scaffold1350_cov249-Pinguiococcus_pyrenoidosus.AAC.13
MYEEGMIGSPRLRLRFGRGIRPGSGQRQHRRCRNFFFSLLGLGHRLRNAECGMRNAVRDRGKAWSGMGMGPCREPDPFRSPRRSGLRILLGLRGMLQSSQPKSARCNSTATPPLLWAGGLAPCFVVLRHWRTSSTLANIHLALGSRRIHSRNTHTSTSFSAADALVPSSLVCKSVRLAICWLPTSKAKTLKLSAFPPACSRSVFRISEPLGGRILAERLQHHPTSGKSGTLGPHPSRKVNHELWRSIPVA